MRIGINAQLISRSNAGVAVYAGELIRTLLDIDDHNNYTIFGNRHSKDRAAAGNSLFLGTSRLVKGSLSRILWEQLILPLKAKMRGVDIMHYPDHTAPLMRKFYPTVITVHDLAPLSFPRTFAKARRTYKALSIRRSVGMADRVIAVSEATKRDCMRLLNLPEDKLRVVYNGVSPEFRPIEDKRRLEEVRVRLGLPEKMALYVGTLEPRKNVTGLIRAFGSLKSTKGLKHVLVITGMKGWLYGEIFKTVEKLGLYGCVKFTGYVDKEDLPCLYNLADVFVYPSFYEGFGLPALEAMACGCPVITSNTSSLPEVVGGAGILTDPRDREALAGAIYRSITNEGLRQRMRAEGLKRAKRFSWERCARETLKVYEEVLSGGRSPGRDGKVENEKELFTGCG